MKYPLNVGNEIAVWWFENVPGVGRIAKQSNINISWASTNGRNGFSIDQKVSLKDPSDESSDIPLFAKIRGFYSDELFLSDGFILPINSYKAILEHDRTFLKMSKYPNTEDLREYCNWLFLTNIKRKDSDLKNIAHHAMLLNSQYGIDGESVARNESMKLLKNFNIHTKSRQQGLEFIPRHLHYDDFIETWNGKIEIIQHRNHHDFQNYIYPGIIISSNFKPANSRNPLNQINWFGNVGYDPEYEDFKRTVIYKMFYEPNAVEIFAVLDRDVSSHNELEMWDPVKDVVRVEKILGNVSFLSEFGYICTMSKYKLIIGDLELRGKYVLLLD